MAIPDTPSTPTNLAGEAYSVGQPCAGVNDSCCSPNVGQANATPGSTLIVPYGSKVISTPKGCSSASAATAAAAAATTGTTPGVDCIAGHQLRATSAAFTVPSIGSQGTFASPCANSWAVSGLRIWFPGLGWLQVVAATGSTVVYTNLSMPPNLTMQAQSSFLIQPPLGNEILSALETALCGPCVDTDALPAATNALGCGPDGLGLLSIPTYSLGIDDGALIRFFWDEVVLNTGRTSYNPAVTTTPVSGSIDPDVLGIPAEATHLVLRGRVVSWANANGSLTVNFYLEQGHITAAGVCDITVEATDGEGDTWGEVVVPIRTVAGVRTVDYNLDVVSLAGASGNADYDVLMNVVGYLVPASDVFSLNVS